jgi:hypothetical protein
LRHVMFSLLQKLQREHTGFILNPEDGGSILLRNVCIQPGQYVAQQPRISPPYFFTSPWNFKSCFVLICKYFFPFAQWYLKTMLDRSFE